MPTCGYDGNAQATAHIHKPLLPSTIPRVHTLRSVVKTTACPLPPPIHVSTPSYLQFLELEPQVPTRSTTLLEQAGQYPCICTAYHTASDDFFWQLLTCTWAPRLLCGGLQVRSPMCNVRIVPTTHVMGCLRQRTHFSV